MEIRINENTMAKERINVNKDCCCVTYSRIGERPWRSSSQPTLLAKICFRTMWNGIRLKFLCFLRRWVLGETAPIFGVGVILSSFYECVQIALYARRRKQKLISGVLEK